MVKSQDMWALLDSIFIEGSETGILILQIYFQ